MAEVDRLRVSFGEQAPVPASAALARLLASGPASCRIGEYSAQYAIGGLAQIAFRSSLEEAAIIAEAAFSTIFVSWSRILITEFEIDESDSRLRLSRLMERTFQLIGEELVRHETPDSIRLEVVRTRLTAPEYEGWETTPDAIPRQWPGAGAWHPALSAHRVR